MRSRVVAPLVALLALGLPISAGARPVPPRPALRWGPEGHDVVARLAESLLTLPVRARIAILLDGRSLEAVANWADSIRAIRRETAPLHYVDIPFDATTYDSARDCPGGRCVIGAIEHDRAVLADTTAPREDRVEALEFLVHFVGDLHQPLHCEDRDDRGGNGVHVTLDGRHTNLHAVWDSGILEAAGLSDGALYARLLTMMQHMNLDTVRAGSVETWAIESHGLAHDAYQIPDDHVLGQDYVRANLPVVELQLVRAGVRLAEILNESLR